MNRKYKGAGCGCGASRSLGFPQTGGQENGMTGFSNSGGIFGSRKRSGGNMVPQRKRQGTPKMKEAMTGGQSILSSARNLFNIPHTETPLTAATGPNTSYPVATNVVSNPPPPPTLPTPNVATSLPSTPVANSSVPNSSVPNSSVANTNTVKAATGFFNSLAKLNPFGSNQGSNVQQEISGGRRTKRNKKNKSKKTKKSKSRR